MGGNVSAEMKKMSRCMFWRNLLLHGTRNTPRQTCKYYHRFIEIIGTDAWDKLSPAYKNPWINARNDFDAMYGLAAAWKNIDDFPLLPKPESIPEAIKEIKPLLDTLSKKLEQIQKAMPAARDDKVWKAACALSRSMVPANMETIRDDESPCVKTAKRSINMASDIARDLAAYNLTLEAAAASSKKE